MKIQYLNFSTFQYFSNITLDLDPYYLTIRIGFKTQYQTYYNKLTETMSETDTDEI